MLCPLSYKHKPCFEEKQKARDRVPNRSFRRTLYNPRAEPELNGPPGVAYDRRMAALAGAPGLLSGREPGWIYKPSWDLPLLIFSAALVPLPFLVAWLAQAAGFKQQQAIDLINIAVAALI